MANAQIPGSVHEGSLDGVLADPPYNQRREAKRPRSSHDSLTQDQMKEFARVCQRVLTHEATVLLFCTVKQFQMWVDIFEDIRDTSGEEGDAQTNAFHVTKRPIHIVWAPGHKHTPGRTHHRYDCTVEYIFFCQRTRDGVSLPHNETVRPAGFVPCSQGAHTDVIDNVQRLSPGEAVMLPNPDHKGSTIMARPEQKSITLILELLVRYFKRNARVWDGFMGTGTTAVACLMSPLHHMFIGTEPDDTVFDLALDRVVDTLARQLATNERQVAAPPVLGSAICRAVDVVATRTEIMTAAEMVYKNIREYEEGKTSTVRLNEFWVTPPGFPAHTSLPDAIIQSWLDAAGVSCNDSYIFGQTFDEWPREVRAQVLQVPLSVRCTLSRLICGTSRIRKRRQPSQGPGSRTSTVGTKFNQPTSEKLYTTAPVCKGSTVGYVFGYLVYVDLGSKNEHTKMYGRENVLVSMEQVRKLRYTLRVYGLSNKGVVIPNVYLVPHYACIVSQCRRVPESEANIAVQLPAEDITVDVLSNHNSFKIIATCALSAGSELLLAETS